MKKRDFVDLTKIPNKMKHRVGFILSFKKSAAILVKPNAAIDELSNTTTGSEISVSPEGAAVSPERAVGSSDGAVVETR